MKQTKNLKKRLAAWMACMIAVVMACTALPATVSATETPAPGTSSADANKGIIIIDNPKKGVTYSGYKIFNVTYTTSGDDNKKSYSYSIEGTSDWYSIVNDYADTTGSGLTLTKAAGTDEYVVSITEGFSAADFAKYLSENVGTITPTFTLALADNAAEGTPLQKDTLALGYYFVKGSSGALCNLTTTDPKVTIHDKNDVPFKKEVAEDADGTKPDKDGVQVGQKLTYTITGSVPDTAGFETYVYKARDIMDKGLTFNKDVEVTIGGNPVTLTEITAENPTGNLKYIDAGEYTYPAGHTPDKKDTGGGFELSLDLKDQTYGAPIVITYTATVNEDAVTVISENEAVLNYGNDEDDDMQSTPPQTVKTVSSEIIIDKYKKVADESDTSNKLAGAKFVLKRGSGNDEEYYKGTFSGTGTDADPIKLTNVEWVKPVVMDGKSVIPNDATVVTTDANGAAAFAGVKNGTYQLVETEAPAGYNLLKDPVDVTVNAVLDDDGNLKTDAGYTTMEITVPIANSDGSFLPSTGGIGTTLFYVGGIGLMLLAVILLVIKGRRGAEKR